MQNAHDDSWSIGDVDRCLGSALRPVGLGPRQAWPHFTKYEEMPIRAIQQFAHALHINKAVEPTGTEVGTTGIPSQPTSGQLPMPLTARGGRGESVRVGKHAPQKGAPGVRLYKKRADTGSAPTKRVYH